MPLKMTRGKNQILFNFLPERTVEFPKGTAIARITQILGTVPQDLNQAVIMRRIGSEIRAWREEWRPVLRDQVLNDPNRFELLDPEAARSELFPRVFWCQNRSCGRIFDYSRATRVPPARCSGCRNGDLVQLRFVKIHNCGHLQPLTPPSCSGCQSGTNQMALDTRGSERMLNFRWVCRNCGTQTGLYAGLCPVCPNTIPLEERELSIQIHRAAKTYFPRTTTLLNIPHGQLQALFARPESDWSVIVAAKYLNLPEIGNRRLVDLAGPPAPVGATPRAAVSAEALAELTQRMQSGEITIQEMASQMEALTRQAQQATSATAPNELRTRVTEQTGVALPVWTEAGYDLLESVLPNEGVTADLINRPVGDPAIALARQLGLAQVQLLSDFPIITATYGFSRSDDRPNYSRLNPFPPDPRRGGRFPIFVDKVQADAIRIKLSSDRLLQWLAANGCQPDLPAGNDPQLARDAYFVRLFHDQQLHSTIQQDARALRMVFGVLHTLCHLSIRQAALLCGQERTSLSEYILPKSIEYMIYCNHRDSATIGALTSMFEQSLYEWLAAIRDTRGCVYDPVCADGTSTCHACTHLAETSCRFFNLNLSRALLFGGHDPVLGQIIGFFDPGMPLTATS